MLVKVEGLGMPRDDEIHIVSRLVSIKRILFFNSHNDRTLNRVLNGTACDILESSNMAYFITSDFGLYSLPKLKADHTYTPSPCQSQHGCQVTPEWCNPTC